MKFKKILPHAKLPTRAHDDDLGLDLYSAVSVFVPSHDNILIRTGIAAEFDVGIGGIIKDRSSVASRRRLYIKAGVIDPSYRGEIFILMENPTEHNELICIGEKIAQLVLIQSIPTTIDEVGEFTNITSRNTDGFGSTGN